MWTLPAGKGLARRHAANASWNSASFGNFCVDPSGLWLYARSGDTLRRVDTTTGAISIFASGLSESSGYADSIFGPSSSGSGMSLYIGDGTTIWEVTGFVPAPCTGATAFLGVALLARRRRPTR